MTECWHDQSILSWNTIVRFSPASAGNVRGGNSPPDYQCAQDLSNLLANREAAAFSPQGAGITFAATVVIAKHLETHSEAQ